jgi:CheY-like chemotaxis protein
MKINRILLIDDDDDDQLIFRDALRETAHSCECRVASNGLEGLAILNGEKKLPDMIFLDLNMPLMNGVEFLKQIKQHAAYKLIPVIIFTTSNSPDDIENLPKLGANRIITKSADFRQLIEKLLEILNE